MKRCPACQKVYDDSSVYCSIDAKALTQIDDREGVKLSKAISMAPDPYLGRTLNKKYRVDLLLGRGGMGAVYQATDLVLDRTVALKLLRQDVVGDENLDNRFLREARAAARIEHPNAVTVYEFGTLDDGSAYIVMEFIKGTSLRSLIKRSGALPVNRALEFMKQACSAVAAAHKVGVIHRDLKPENIMLKDVGVGLPVVKVVDFGLAKLKESVSQSLANLTNEGDILGTPYYMSPEQCSGIHVDERSDIYSLGVIFYEMMSGYPPFQGTAAAVIGMHLYKEPAVLASLDSAIPERYSSIVMSMLIKEREKRLAPVTNVLQKLDALTPFSTGKNSPIKPPPEVGPTDSLTDIDKTKIVQQTNPGQGETGYRPAKKTAEGVPVDSEARLDTGAQRDTDPQAVQTQYSLPLDSIPNSVVPTLTKPTLPSKSKDLPGEPIKGANLPLQPPDNYQSGNNSLVNTTSIPQTIVVKAPAPSNRIYYILAACGLIFGLGLVLILDKIFMHRALHSPAVNPNVVTPEADKTNSDKNESDKNGDSNPATKPRPKVKAKKVTSSQQYLGDEDRDGQEDKEAKRRVKRVGRGIKNIFRKVFNERN